MKKEFWNTIVTLSLFKQKKSECKKCAGTKLCSKHKKLFSLIGSPIEDADPKLLN